jgi:proline iminopeptidase
MKTITSILFLTIFLTVCCTDQIDHSGEQHNKAQSYLDYSDRDDILSGGVKMIGISTPEGVFEVWTKRIGNNPDIKVLLLHGGPGYTHEYLECFDSFFPPASIEYYYYDQLGSYYSDQPPINNLLNIDRFVEEVEQVREALKLDSSNFYLLGHSWGGILAIEYALKYQEHLKGLIISNMMSSAPDYDRYATEVLAPKLDPEILAEIRDIEAREDYSNPRYMELLEPYYTEHLLRMPINEWPEPVDRSSKHFNPEVYISMQGPSELGMAGDVILKDWDRSTDLKQINTPALVIGAKYDTMDPEHMKWMASQFPKGQYLFCPNGSHMAMYDDQETYFQGLIKFIFNVDHKK